MSEQCLRCGGSGRNYVDGWACRSSIEHGSRASVCPACQSNLILNRGDDCAKELAIVGFIQQHGVLGERERKNRFTAPECRCKQCIKYDTTETYGTISYTNVSQRAVTVLAPIRLAVIGMGWGFRYIPSAWEAGNAIVTHVAGGLPMTKLPGVPWPDVEVEARDWRKLLDAPVDAFVVATPPETHEEIARELLEAGKPVMLEKPMALDLGAAIRIQIAAKKSGALLLVNHQHLFSPAYEELLERVASWDYIASSSSGGALGPYRTYSALWDYGPHDVAMHLGLPQARADWEHGYQLLAGSRAIGHFRFAFDGPSFSAIVRVWNDRQPKARGFIVVGDGGQMIVYDDLDPEGCRLRLGATPIAVSGEKPLARSIRAFAKAVREGGTDDWRFRPDFGVEVTRILSLVSERSEARPSPAT